MIVIKRNKNIGSATKLFMQVQQARQFSSQQTETTTESSATDYATSGTETDGKQRVKNVIDPYKGQYTDFLKNVPVYEDSNKDSLKTMYFLDAKQRLPGWASAEGTDKYYRMSQYGEVDNLDVHPDGFRWLQHDDTLRMTSLGIGTYVGDPDDRTDFDMYNAIKTAVLSGGVNHIDTAPNYRYMKSERTVGKILNVLDRKYDITRDQLFVASKAGYVPEDAENLISQRDMVAKLVSEAGVPEDAIQKESMHCLHPKFLEQQLEESLDRLNLDCLDIYYLQNAYEAQAPYNTDNAFFDQLAAAFEFLESAVAAGKIRNYGLATYSSLRTKPTDTKMHLNL